jgi:hypothetical protein
MKHYTAVAQNTSFKKFSVKYETIQIFQETADKTESNFVNDNPNYMVGGHIKQNSFCSKSNQSCRN